MMEQLIDTIFYYADTLLEYLDAVRDHKVLSRTIVFVDETGEIYKNGKVFGSYEKLIDVIDALGTEMRTAMLQSEESLNALINQLRELLRTKFLEDLDDLANDLDNYKDRLDALRAEFDGLNIEEGDVRLIVDNLRGLIEDIATWKSSAELEMVTLRSILDAQSGQIIRFGERLDTLYDRVTNFNEIIDLQNQTFQLYIENYDITNKVKTILGREMLLLDGLLHDYATKTDLANQIENSIDVYFNALEPSWTQITQRVWAVGDLINTAIAGFRSEIEPTIDGLVSKTTTLSDWYDQYGASTAAFITAALSGQASFDIIASLLDDATAKTVAARIFGFANQTGSKLLLNADQIQLQGTTWADLINAQQLVADAISAVTLTASSLDILVPAGSTASNYVNRILINENGIIHTNRSTGKHGFQFNIDGSGNLSNGKIYWDTQGNLTIDGQTNTSSITTNNITINNSVINNTIISDYWSKTELSVASKNKIVKLTNALSGNGDDWDPDTSTLAAWVIGKIADAQLPEGSTLTIQLTVNTYLDNKINEVNGPFSNFVTDSELQLAGYVRSEGLGTTISAALYDSNGNLITSNTPLWQALSNLKMLSTALIDANAGEVVGLVQAADLSTSVLNIVNDTMGYSDLYLWSLDVLNYTTTGFDLGAYIKKLSPGINSALVSAYISGVVNGTMSSITIHADQIELDGKTIFDTLSGTYTSNYHQITGNPEGNTYTIGLNPFGMEIKKEEYYRGSPIGIWSMLSELGRTEYNRYVYPAVDTGMLHSVISADGLTLAKNWIDGGGDIYVSISPSEIYTYGLIIGDSYNTSTGGSQNDNQYIIMNTSLAEFNVPIYVNTTSNITFNSSNGNATQSITSNGTYLDLGSDGKIRIGQNNITFYSGSNAGSFTVNHERIYLEGDTIRLGESDGDTTIQLYGDIVTRNGDVDINGNLDVNGTIRLGGGVGSLITIDDNTHLIFHSELDNEDKADFYINNDDLEIEIPNGKCKIIGDLDIINGDITFNASNNNTAKISYNSSNGRIEFTKAIKSTGNYANDIGFLRISTVDNDGAASLSADLGTLSLVNNGNLLSLSCPNGTLNLYATTAIKSNLSITVTSDITLKNIVEYAEASIESIAETPIFYYKWKNIESNSIYLGTSAQYIQTIFPHAVKVLEDNTLTLDYASTALASAVTAAREIVALKARVAELEAKLNNL